MDRGGVEGWAHAWAPKPKPANDHREHPLPPTHRPRLCGGASGCKQQHGHSPGGESPAAGRHRGVPRVATGARVPRARTHTRTGPRAPASRPDRARATGREERAWAADLRRGRHRRGRRGGREMGNTARKGRTVKDGGPKTRSHPAIPAGPRHEKRDHPQPPTPQGQHHPQAACCTRKLSKGRQTTEAWQARGVTATSHPLLPSCGQRPTGHRGRGHCVFT